MNIRRFSWIVGGIVVAAIASLTIASLTMALEIRVGFPHLLPGMWLSNRVIPVGQGGDYLFQKIVFSIAVDSALVFAVICSFVWFAMQFLRHKKRRS